MSSNFEKSGPDAIVVSFFEFEKQEFVGGKAVTPIRVFPMSPFQQQKR
ncbi:MAG: hypothetical protein GY758_15280 [Fuerstiella sp.]|nr:hypothetical protein [Fuerstiella sp.]